VARRLPVVLLIGPPRGTAACILHCPARGAIRCVTPGRVRLVRQVCRRVMSAVLHLLVYAIVLAGGALSYYGNYLMYADVFTALTR
jgi:hypothetical protein